LARFNVGVDLGQSRDYTAIAVVEKVREEVRSAPSAAHGTYAADY
jgi:hypothetical protein